MTPDPWYPTYRTQLDAIGVPNFPYLIMTPNLDTPEAQAKKALDVVGTLNNHYFPLAIDVEGNRNGLTAAQWLDWVERAYAVIKAALGVPPVLYTSRSTGSIQTAWTTYRRRRLADCLAVGEILAVPGRRAGRLRSCHDRPARRAASPAAVR